MSDAVADAPVEPKKSNKLPVILGIALAVAGAGGGFFAVTSGLLSAPEEAESHETMEQQPDALPDIAFVEVDPILISLLGSQHVKHLRFRTQLEVNAAYADDVRHLLPRVTDVMNSYLRALKISDFEEATALIRIRSQLLRRLQVVAGKGRIRDLLIMEYVLN